MKVASEAASALESLREVQSSLSADTTATGVSDGLSRLTGEINAQIADDAELLRSNPTLQMLYPIKITWQNFSEKLSAWNNNLTRSGTNLDEELARLDEKNRIWQLTLQSIQGSGMPEVVRRAKDVIDSIRETRQAVDSRRPQILDLQNRTFEQAGRIRNAFNLIEQAEQQALASILSRDSPPVWDLKASFETAWTSTHRSFSMQLRALSAYARRFPLSFPLHGLIILVLAGAMHWFGRRVSKWSEREPSLQGVVPVFDLPVSTALVLSCFLFRRSLYPQAPRLLLAIIGAAALIPTVLILRRLLERNQFPILNALVIMFFVDQLRQIAAAIPLVDRFLFLAQMLGAILFLLWLIRGRHLAIVGDKTGGRLLQGIRIGIWIGLIFFSAAFLTNIFGYTKLATLLASTFLFSAYYAAILYTVIRIADGLIVIALAVGPIASLRAFRLHRPMVHREMYRALEFLAFVLWLNVLSNFFGLRRPLIGIIGAALRSDLTIGSLSLSLGHVLAFVVTVWASFLFSKFLRFLLEEDVYHHFQLPRGIPQAISTMVQYVVILLGFFVAMQMLGVDLNKLTILAGAFTVGVGFGLQNIINNFVSGLILLFERPIKVGDMIDVSGTVGEVRRIGIRATVVRTPDGSEVIIPNGTLISSQVTNWTLTDQQRAVEIPVTVVRGATPPRVVELLKTVAANHPGIAKQPEPQAYVLSFTSAAITFQLRAWINRYSDWAQVRSDLSVAVDDALAREHIGIP
jgi:small-conductance mechanosensitive channel